MNPTRLRTLPTRLAVNPDPATDSDRHHYRNGVSGSPIIPREMGVPGTLGHRVRPGTSFGLPVRREGQQ